MSIMGILHTWISPTEDTLHHGFLQILFIILFPSSRQGILHQPFLATPPSPYPAGFSSCSYVKLYIIMDMEICRDRINSLRKRLSAIIVPINSMSIIATSRMDVKVILILKSNP